MSLVFIVVWFLCNVLNILLLIMLKFFVVYWHRNWLYIAWVFFFFFLDLIWKVEFLLTEFTQLEFKIKIVFEKVDCLYKKL